jgi:hypothetical protein
LRAPTLDLTGADLFLPSRDRDGHSRHNEDLFKDWLNSSPFLDLMQRNNLKFTTSYVFKDYDLTTADPPYMHGHVVKALMLAQENDWLHGLVVRQTNEKPVTYERIGALSICLSLIKPLDKSPVIFRDDTMISLWDFIPLLPVEEIRIL